MPDDKDLHLLAAAMLDGAPVDWESAASETAGEPAQAAVRALKIIAAIADVHSGASLPDVDHLNPPHREPDTPPPASSEQPQESWGSLRLLEKVGEGAYGEVYRAWDPRLDREVALKLLRRNDFEHGSLGSVVIDEGRMLAQVRHPNVVTVHGADHDDGRVGLWMEFVHGRTLEQVLRDEGPFTAEQVTRIGRDLCRALAAVHRAGLLHRDIKAHNVMREDGGRIVLMDFGTGVERADDSMALVGAMVGTPLYMAPECLNGGETTVRSDLYAVGVLLYHLVTGSYPIQGQSVQAVRDAHLRGDRTLLRNARPDLPKALVQVIERALAPNPEARYESTDAMEAALAATTGDAAKWRKVAVAAGLVLVAVTTLFWLVWLAVRTPERPAIAVLPLDNLSTDSAQEYFAIGLTDELITSLAQIRALRVVSPASAMSLKGSTKSLSQIARELNVDWLIKASVQRAGNRVRIRIQLFDASSETYRWAREYDRDLSDVLKLQRDMARALAEEMRVNVAPLERERMASVTAVDAAAHDEYLLGRYLFWKFTEEDRIRAIDHFNRAIQIDPRYAAAYAGVARAWWLRGVFGPLSLKEAAPPARAAARKALELDDRLAEAYAAQALIEGTFDWNWAGAERTIGRAIELDSNSLDARYVYALLLMALGRHAEAITQIEYATRLDPLSAQVHSTFGRILFRARRFDEAILHLNRALELEPRNAQVHHRLGDVYEQMGKHAEALALYDKHPENAGTPVRIARVYARMGKTQEARQRIEGLGVRAGGPAAVYAELGDKETAFKVLFDVVEERTDFSIYIKSDPWFESLHTDRRWTDLLRRMNLPID